MNTDVEELLREGMERFTQDLRAPAELTRLVARRRRRRLLRRSMTAVSALAVLAVALVVVVVPGTGLNSNEESAVLAAAMVKRVNRALSAADPGAIAQMKVTIRSGKTVAATAEEWSNGDERRSVTYSRAGHPIDDEGSTSTAYTVVSYPTRTWARLTATGRGYQPGSGPSGCMRTSGPGPLLFQPGLPGTGFSDSSLTVVKALRAAISCGTLAVAGRQRVDGIDAVKLTSRPASMISETIWVSPGTYLPVRVTIRSGAGAPALQQTADITWLPPTPQNLAKLTVPIPAGFHRVALGDVLRSIVPMMPVGLMPTGTSVVPPLPLRTYPFRPNGPQPKSN